MMTREEIIDKIADLYIEGSDSEGSWESEILEAVMNFIVAEGGDRLQQCDDCSTWYPQNYYQCPYYDSHDCEECGNRNDECSCDDCPDCHIYYEDCECPRCTICGEKRGVCTHPEEEVVFQ